MKLNPWKGLNVPSEDHMHADDENASLSRLRHEKIHTFIDRRVVQEGLARGRQLVDDLVCFLRPGQHGCEHAARSSIGSGSLTP